MANNSFDIKKTNNHTKNAQHISVSAITFTGYTQSQKIVNKNNWNIWDQATTVSNLCSQPWLRSPMHERRYPDFWYIRRVWKYESGNQNP
jgi:hypothetical protein